MLDHLYQVKRKDYERAKKLSQYNQVQFYQELAGKSHVENVIPDKEKK